MKKNIILILFFMFEGTFPLSAQNLFKGKFIDENNLPIEFLQVTASINDSLINGAITDVDGEFSFSLPKGEFRIVADLFGKTLYTKDVSITQSMDIDTIQVSSQVLLDEITVVSQKKLFVREIDRIVFNVENSISSSGGDALDVLKITPKVRVQEDQISMIGKSGMSVMVDDRLIQLSGEDLMTFLRSIKSEDIKSIEVITTPPAKYDAEGNSGIVNVKLKTVKKDSWNTSVNTFYQQATYAKGGGGANFNIRKNKLTLSSGVRYSNGSIKRVETSDLFYSTTNWRTTFNKRFYSDFWSGKFSINYQLKPNWSFGLQYLGSSSRPVNDEKDLGIVTNNITMQVDSLINTMARSEKLKLLNNVNAYTKIELDSLGRNISFDFTFFDYLNNTKRDNSTEILRSEHTIISNGTPQVTNGKQKIQSYGGIIDMEHPFNWISINYGAKVSSVTTTNDLEVFDFFSEVPVLNLNQSNVFSFKENTQALYLSGQKQFNEKWEMKLGLRVENTQTEGYSRTLDQSNKNNYTSVFPTYYLSYEPNDKHSFSMDYARRIRRPSYSNLNPFRFYSSPYNYYEGNPFLKPKFSHNVGFEYGFNHSLYTTLSFLNQTQGIGSVPFVNESTSTQYFTYLNYYTYNAAGLTLAYNFSELKWWESNNSIDVYYGGANFSAEIELPNTNSWGMYFSSNNSFVMNAARTIKGEINFWYEAPDYHLLYKRDARYNLDLGIRLSLLESKNLKLSIQAKDILKSDIGKKATSSDGIEQYYTYYQDQRRLKISLSYLFGNKKIRTRSKRFGNEDERNRVN